MNLEGLRYAQAVWHTKSFTAAARANGVTQPALSQSIVRLEKELGVRLFDRTPRGATPTPDGARILPIIQRTLGTLDSALAEAKRLSQQTPQAIRVGISAMTGKHLLSRAVQAASELGASNSLVLRNADLNILRKALEDGELDILLIPVVAPVPGFRHQVIDREPMGVVNSCGWSGETGPIELKDAADADYIMVPDTCGLRTFTTALFEKDNLSLRMYAGEASNVRVLGDWARMGLGAALLPWSEITQQRQQGRPLVRGGKPVEVEYEAVWSAENALVAELETFIGRIREQSTAVWEASV